MFETASFGNIAVVFLLLAALLGLWWFNAVFAAWVQRVVATVQSWFTVNRYAHNPLLKPTAQNGWEAHSVFNPAAAYINGRVHLLYRAIGADGVSRIGYASSADGFNFDERLLYPVFELRNPRQCYPCVKRFDPVLYPSGGSWGGCEDPRMVVIGETVHLTFNAFDGWDFVRIGEVRVGVQDFIRKWWAWTQPILLSPEKEIHKNWVLFPEKIKGKYALLHSINPEVQIDYVDHLEDLARGKVRIRSTFGSKTPRATWDTWVRGVGPPPIKTEAGWLVLYHATEARDPGKYKIGALLLDVGDPRHVLARSPGPILSPETPYENYWKQGVVYTCGAVIKDDELLVYYGGGDHTVNVAHAPIAEILKSILSNHTPTLAHTSSPV